MRVLIKIGGTLLDAPESRARLAQEIASAFASHEIVVVHGGGKQMNRFLAERGIESKFVNGLRVTTDEILDAVLKVFAGSVNAGLVSAFRAAGANPVGLTGLDGGIVDAEILDPALGHVGRAVDANAHLLETLIRVGYLPVVACVAGDPAGAIFNINGDQMAVACATAFEAEKLLFLTDVDGVRGADGERAPQLTATEALGLIKSRVATAGMQAKLESAVSAVRSGVKEVLILPGFREGVIDAALAGANIGTRIVC